MTAGSDCQYLIISCRFGRFVYCDEYRVVVKIYEVVVGSVDLAVTWTGVLLMTECGRTAIFISSWCDHTFPTAASPSNTSLTLLLGLGADASAMVVDWALRVRLGGAWALDCRIRTQVCEK